MLSIENLPSADPNEISFKGVDLSNPSLDDHNSIPKFSIRNYVFNARSKDIKTNWPFSQKNLQLCLEHGVKDILPPFQCHDCVKNRPSERDGVESSSSEKGNIMNSDVERLNKFGNIDPIGYKSCDKQLLVTINNLSPQKVLPKPYENPKTHFPKKLEISKPPSAKKCRLTLKVGPKGVEPNTNLNTSLTIVEPLASSKVCPVCKKFSSSSNTTLNAHIDQCLSMDSLIEPRSKSTMIKHRIKPRKTRLMVDIYATAPHCTLEELDRRNGRIWNEKHNLPTIQEDEAVGCGEEKNRSDGFDDKRDDGAVYVDANGTKLRILNRISGTSSVSKLGVNHRRFTRLGKPLKVDVSTFKKKKKHSKYLKLASQREKTCAYKTRLASRVFGDQGKEMTLEESPRKDGKALGNITQVLKSREQSINSGTRLPKWGSSQGTDLLKRRFESDQSSLSDSYLQRSYSQKCSGIDNSSCEGSVNKILEQIPSKKHMGFKSFEPQSIASSREQILSVDKSSSSQPKSSKVVMFRAKNGDDYDENYLDHQLILDEDAGQVPVRRSTVLKIKKKKSQAIFPQTNEPTQDCDNRENPPPPRVTADFEDKFVNMEPHHGTRMVIGQSSGNGTFDQHFYSIDDVDMETEPGPTDTLGNYFSGVDPITIPGPPGSFLPSPGRSSSDDDIHGNSSLTTSQVQSPGEHLKIVDRDSSNSPKSANSTVLNSLITRSDLKPTENLSSVPQDDIIKLGFSDEITKSTLGFQDGQPCCCSRKERDCQESQLLRRRGMPSFLVPTVDKNQDKVNVKPSVYGDFGSPSPSSPNPVLRLMGKNLIVVNNDENISQIPTSKFQSGPLDNQFHEFKPSFAGLNRSISSPFSPLRYNKNERVETLSKEPNEVHTDGMNVIQTSSGGFPIPLPDYYSSGNLNPFHRHQGTDFSAYGGPHMIPYVSAQICPPSSGPMRWNNSVLEGSNMLPQSSLASSPSTNRARPSFYYSSGMS